MKENNTDYRLGLLGMSVLSMFLLVIIINSEVNTLEREVKILQNEVQTLNKQLSLGE